MADDTGDPPFSDLITTTEALRTLYRDASELVERKKIDHLDGGCRRVIAVSPLVLVGTSDADGRCDVSPRGGPPGFVQVLDDHRLAIPDLNGNNLLDSITNVIDNPHVGLLFVQPGRDETLRVEGRAWLTTQADVLDGFTSELKRPKAAIGVAVERAFVHCAKSFRRGQVWDPTTWTPDAAPSVGEMLTEAMNLDIDPQLIDDDLEEGYAAALAAEKTGGPDLPD
jgi:PPOX class probable FMN-dependent enzyme